MTKKVKWYLSIGLVGCRVRGEIEVDDDASEAEIEEAVREEIMERIEWGFEE